MRPRRLLLTCCLLTTLAGAQSASRELNIMPLPASYQTEEGQLAIDQSFTVGLTGYREPRLGKAVKRFLRTLSHQTGMAFPQTCAQGLRRPWRLHRSRQQARAGTRRRRVLFPRGHECWRNPQRPNSPRHSPRSPDFSTFSTRHSQRATLFPSSASRTSLVFPGAASWSTSAATSFRWSHSAARSMAWKPSN